MRPQGSRVPSGDSQRPVTALPWLRSVPGGLLPLVGRTEELAVVTEALTHAAHGQGRSILITGPAGRGNRNSWPRLRHWHRSREHWSSQRPRNGVRAADPMMCCSRC
jgi:hypothetical protein